MNRLPNPIDVHVGSRIRLRRSIAGLSQEQLADGLGLTFQQVQKYEKGINRVSASRLQHISEVLEVPISFFFENGPNALVNSAGSPMGEFNELMSSKETIALVTAFNSIKSPRLRQSVLNLVRTLRNDPSSAGEEDHNNASI
ncbi:helix-turn-helix transcriptional regulator [Rhizobium sp. CG4]|jgi:transcriptional regulator with XRE-family HTH domain|uniref:helix-turn-helix domain-containing protein n=1 Tax=Rhizobium/Agrobacterium group TaxID=227290 RepID=UPI00203400C6|nr:MULTISPECIES: helix-turn-helix transcriptional regulator [Rhizobium/Agrobacterium group]MCM2456589.1 helix-turn-helix transcriptional regulator [Rhizobium sp. CG4]MCS4244199.1 transcriptional regulator with XRE-family HTH domain [Rhizobium sp. BIGb0125]MDO5898695.1 helix-turn-helix transcriptional regulator [Agrobacterium sp. Azo12]